MPLHLPKGNRPILPLIAVPRKAARGDVAVNEATIASYLLSAIFSLMA